MYFNVNCALKWNGQGDEGSAAKLKNTMKKCVPNKDIEGRKETIFSLAISGSINDIK
jgi:hypothetical protein